RDFSYADGTYQGSETLLHDHAGLLHSQIRYQDAAGTEPVGSTTLGYHGDEVSSIQDLDTGGSVLADFGYRYDQARRVTWESTDGTTIGYGYDPTSQLRQA